MYKQVIFLSLLGLLIIFISCNEDETPKQDFVVGEWQPLLAFGDGKFFEYTECEKQGTIKFEPTGIYSGITYLETVNEDNEVECTLVSSESGTWIKLAENSYEISVDTITKIIEIIEINTDTIRFQPDKDNYAELIRIPD
jgi:hypothetical protein